MDGFTQSGAIDNFRLAKVFEHVAENRLTGVLEVRAEQGRKVILLEKGKVALVSEGEFRRDYVGDVLVARGKITREDLDRALQEQKFRNTRLGETLAEMGLVSKGDIEDVLKYQVEEELCDLFSWRKGTYEFRPEAALPEELDGSAVHLAVDPKALLAEAAKRLRMWPELEKFVPSPLAVFKLTDSGRTLLEAASSGGAKRFLSQVDQGLPVKEIVRRSYLGRFTVYKTLSDLIRKDQVVERSAGEMELLARDRIRAGEYELARMIYRRLLETAQAPTQKQRYKEQLLYIDDLEHQTRKMKAARDTTTVAARITAARPVTETGAGEYEKTVKLKPPPARVPYWKRILPVAAAVLALLAIGAGAALLSSPYLREMVFDTAAKEIPGLFGEVDAAISAGDYEKAIALLTAFLAEHPASPSSDRVAEKLRAVKRDVDAAAGEILLRARKLRKSGDTASALRLVSTAVEKLPFTSQLGELIKLRTVLRRELDKKNEKERLALFSNRISTAENLFLEGRPEDAASAASALLEEDGLPDTVASRAKALLSDVEDLRNRQERLLSEAFKARNDGRFDLAERRLNEIIALAPHSAYALRAAKELESITRRRSELDAMLKRAAEILASGKPLRALEIYRRVAAHSGYFQAQLARKRVEEIERSAEEASRLLASYKRAVRDRNYPLAQDLYEKLVLKYAPFTDINGLLRPVSIASVPSGAFVFLDGEPQGRTPLTVMIPGGRRVIIKVEKDGFRSFETVLDDPLRRTVGAYLVPEPVKVIAWNVPSVQDVHRLSPGLFLALTPRGTFLLRTDDRSFEKVLDEPALAWAADGRRIFLAGGRFVYRLEGGRKEKFCEPEVGRPLAMFSERLPRYRNAEVLGVFGTGGAAVYRVRDRRRLDKRRLRDVKSVLLLPQTAVLYDGSTLLGMDRSGLAPRWSIEIGPIPLGPVGLETGAFAFIDSEARMVEMNAGTGRLSRRKPLPGLSPSGGTIAAGGGSIVWLRNEFVRRLDWETGLLWERALDRDAVPGMLVVGEDSVFTAARDALFRLALEDGAIEMKTAWPGRILALHLDPSGLLYVFSTRGDVLTASCIRAAAEPGDRQVKVPGERDFMSGRGGVE